MLSDIERFKKWHTLILDSFLKRADSARVECWSKAYVVGEEQWLKERLAEAGIKRMKKNNNDVSFTIGKTP